MENLYLKKIQVSDSIEQCIENLNINSDKIWFDAQKTELIQQLLLKKDFQKRYLNGLKDNYIESIREKEEESWWDTWWDTSSKDDDSDQYFKNVNYNSNLTMYSPESLKISFEQWQQYVKNKVKIIKNEYSSKNPPKDEIDLIDQVQCIIEKLFSSTKAYDMFDFGINPLFPDFPPGDANFNPEIMLKYHRQLEDELEDYDTTYAELDLDALGDMGDGGLNKFVFEFDEHSFLNRG